jgi:hypothetical protein
MNLERIENLDCVRKLLRIDVDELAQELFEIQSSFEAFHTRILRSYSHDQMSKIPKDFFFETFRASEIKLCDKLIKDPFRATTPIEKFQKHLAIEYRACLERLKYVKPVLIENTFQWHFGNNFNKELIFETLHSHLTEKSVSHPGLVDQRFEVYHIEQLFNMGALREPIVWLKSIKLLAYFCDRIAIEFLEIPEDIGARITVEKYKELRQWVNPKICSCFVLDDSSDIDPTMLNQARNKTNLETLHYKQYVDRLITDLQTI